MIAADGKGDRMRANTVLVVRALLLGVLTSVALAALSVLLQPELSKYSLLVSKDIQLSPLQLEEKLHVHSKHCKHPLKYPHKHLLSDNPLSLNSEALSSAAVFRDRCFSVLSRHGINFPLFSISKSKMQTVENI